MSCPRRRENISPLWKVWHSTLVRSMLFECSWGKWLLCINKLLQQDRWWSIQVLAQLWRFWYESSALEWTYRLPNWRCWILLLHQACFRWKAVEFEGDPHQQYDYCTFEASIDNNLNDYTLSLLLNSILTNKLPSLELLSLSGMSTSSLCRSDHEFIGNTVGYTSAAMIYQIETERKGQSLKTLDLSRISLSFPSFS